MSDDLVWGYSPAEWTAIGTIVLTAVAAASLLVGALTAWQAARSARAAENAAKATSDAVGIQLAMIEVDFELNLVFNEEMAPAAVRLTWRRPTATLHDVSLEFADLGDNAEPAWNGPYRCEPAASAGTLPRRIFPGELVHFMWPYGEVPVPKQVRFNQWIVTYSFSPDGEKLFHKVSARNIEFLA